MPAEFLYLQTAVLLVFFIIHLLMGAFLKMEKKASPFFYDFIAGVAAQTNRKLNREGRPPADLYARGATVVLILGGFSWCLGFGLHKTLSTPWGSAALLASFFASLNIMGIVRVLRVSAKNMKEKNLAAVKKTLAVYLKEPLESADAHTLARRVIEWAAVFIQSCFVAPIFWFVVAGYPAMLLSLALSAVRSEIGTGASRQEFFGSLTRVADRLMTFFPSLITVLLFMIASLFVSGCNFVGVLRGVIQLPGTSKLDIVTPALAGALNVTLGGPRRDSDGAVIDRPWIGFSGTTAKLEHTDVERAALLAFIVFLLMIVVVSGTTIARAIY